MKKLLLLLVLLSTPLVSQSPTMKCSDVDIVTVGASHLITCLDGGGLPPITPLPAVCPPPLFYVVVSGWPRTGPESTRFSYDPSEAATFSVDPQAGKATFTAVRNPACKVTVSK